MKRTSILVLAAAAIMIMPVAAAAQLAPSWMIPAAANTPGVNGTYWSTDVNLHNPHEYDLPVVVQFLPSGQANWSADVVYITMGPWETVNLWDVLGPELFDWNGRGALLIYADSDQIDCSSQGDCDFLATSRTYTPDPLNPGGEFGQALPGVSVDDGLSWDTYAYTTGVMNDGDTFRANAGVASWTAGWTTVQMDVQDAGGNILRSATFEVPPFGMVQRRIRPAVDAGTVVFSLVDGPDDSLVFPYAAVVNQITGDPTYLPTRVSAVGVTIAAIHRAQAGPRPVPMIRNARTLDSAALAKLEAHGRGSRAALKDR